MDCFGASSEGEWSSLSGTYTAEEADFMAQLLVNCSFPSQPLQESFNSDDVSNNSHVINNAISSLLFEHCLDANNGSMSTEPFVKDYMVKGTGLEETATDHKCYLVPQNPRKRARESSDHVEKNKNVKEKPVKKNKKVVSSSSNDEDGGNVVSTSWSGDDDTNGGLSSSTTLTSKGKVRASRGSATDPQSLYARKRRERINERLKILQNLVPNGTKVDISTMLEEAVQYVKFLQLQIKLLSSDDMWMYSPIAYNGMDLGLSTKIHTSTTS